MEITEYRVTLQPARTLSIAEVTCSSYSAAERIARSYFADRLPHEELIAVGLNGRNSVVGLVCVSVGGAHGCAVTPADVLRPLIVMGACAFVLAHNHPSGDWRPSPEDVAMTVSVRDAATLVGLTLLDHVVIAANGAGSVLDCLSANRAA
jgi:DNA repair protein RadC